MTRALIVIDIQNEYFDGALPLWQAEDAEARIISAIARATEAGDRVILVRHGTPEGSPMFAAGSKGGEIRPAILEAAGNAPVVTKGFADAFQDTDLKAHLDGVEELLLCGMMTQNCVAFTALSDDARGYKVTVLGDLCAAPTPQVHAIALNAIRSKRNLADAADIWG